MSHVLTRYHESRSNIRLRIQDRQPYTGEIVIVVLLFLCVLTMIAVINVPEFAEAFGAVSLLS